MKIALLIDELAPGSTPKLIGWPIRELNALDIEAEALVIIDKGHWERNKEHYDQHLKGVKVRYLYPYFPRWAREHNARFPGMSFFSLHHLTAGLYAHRAVQWHEFDMIVSCCQYSSFAARNIKRHCGIPFLQLIWDTSTHTADKIYKKRLGWKYPVFRCAANLLDRYALSECEAVITSGKYHHPAIRKLTQKPIEVLYPACRPIVVPPPFDVRTRTIVTWDRWDIGNDPGVFLDLLEDIDDKDVTLTIGGFWHPESMRSEFDWLVRAAKLQDRVTVLGPLDDNGIAERCSKAMVHVHPCHEAFGMQTLEAAGYACPSIIPAGSGVCELFQDGVSGWHPSDYWGIVHRLNLLFANPLHACKMGRAAHEVAKDRTWANYALDLASIVERYL